MPGRCNDDSFRREVHHAVTSAHRSTDFGAPGLAQGHPGAAVMEAAQFTRRKVSVSDIDAVTGKVLLEIRELQRPVRPCLSRGV
ncbi:hypothetical protein GA0004734_00018500 [Rhizobium sp. 9140]|nr:hypothetical protein GA0004734_00018500 [Rhizobium sp. 9140]